MPRPLTVQQSRAVPVELDRAFELTLPMPLPSIFRRRYALLPPVKEVRGQDGPWGRVGQSGTEITWRWTLHPTAAGAFAMPLVARMWPGYARQALEVLSEQLLAPAGR